VPAHPPVAVPPVETVAVPPVVPPPVLAVPGVPFAGPDPAVTVQDGEYNWPH